MPRYQSQTSRDLEVECLHVCLRKIDYSTRTTDEPLSPELCRKFRAYEEALYERLRISAKLDRSTDPSKYSSLALSVRRMRFGKAYEKQVIALEDQLHDFRGYFGLYERDVYGRWSRMCLE